MLIGLIGYKGSGKSEVAKALESRGFVRRPFAGPIKDMMIALGLNHEQVHGSEKEKPIPQLFDLTPRHLMQTLGTEWARSINPDFWIASWRLRHEPGRLTVVDDVRFPNEAVLINKLGGRLWRVIRPGVDRASDHESEAHVESLPHHRVLWNDKSRNHLHALTIDTLLAETSPQPHAISA